MRRFGLSLLLLLLLPLLVSMNRARAAETREAISSRALSATIDQFIEQAWQGKIVQAAKRADDAEFLRRASLDLLGHIPRVAEVREFLADKSPDKRQRLVERMLASPAYVRQAARNWRATFLSQATAQDLRVLGGRLENWLANRLRQQTPYDELVREILTAPLGDKLATATAADVPTPLSFYQANELKPENLAAAASRVFLGVSLECAQCHNHPFADWKQDQFWQFAGFFAGVTRLRADNAMTPGMEQTDRRELTIPGSERLVPATFLDGSRPEWSPGSAPRVELARWVTSAENRYFARAAVNRIWAQFFGRGIVDPLDDLGGRSKPSHPELLDELARQFIASGFDVPYLQRAIVGTAAYQRTSRLSHDSQREPTLLARMPVRGLSAEQLFDSVSLATGCSEMHRSAVLTAFVHIDRPTETNTSILQALMLMNGTLMASATSLEESVTLAAIAESPYLDERGKVETLYLATLSRLPSDEERQRAAKFIAGAESPRAGLADVFWSLLNSAEFILNH